MAPAKKPAPAPKPENDQGFGPSHGYDESHGGPTGPGDAPASPDRAPRHPPGDDDGEWEKR